MSIVPPRQPLTKQLTRSALGQVVSTLGDLRLAIRFGTDDEILNAREKAVQSLGNPTPLAFPFADDVPLEVAKELQDLWAYLYQEGNGFISCVASGREWWDMMLRRSVEACAKCQEGAPAPATSPTLEDLHQRALSGLDAARQLRFHPIHEDTWLSTQLERLSIAVRVMHWAKAFNGLWEHYPPRVAGQEVYSVHGGIGALCSRVLNAVHGGRYYEYFEALTEQVLDGLQVAAIHEMQRAVARRDVEGRVRATTADDHAGNAPTIASEVSQPIGGVPCKVTIISHGNRRYSTSDKPELVTVSPSDDVILDAFLKVAIGGIASLDTKQLNSHVRSGDPVTTLKQLRRRNKYDGRFSDAITTPGGKANGGYRVRILAATDDTSGGSSIQVESPSA